MFTFQREQLVIPHRFFFPAYCVFLPYALHPHTPCVSVPWLYCSPWQITPAFLSLYFSPTFSSRPGWSTSPWSLPWVPGSTNPPTDVVSWKNSLYHLKTVTYGHILSFWFHSQFVPAQPPPRCICCLSILFHVPGSWSLNTLSAGSFVCQLPSGFSQCEAPARRLGWGEEHFPLSLFSTISLPVAASFQDHSFCQVALLLLGSR